MANWKITGITADGDLITQAKYFVSHQGVETEGYWTFREPKLQVKFEDVTEDMIVKWIKAETMADGKNIIETRLAEQLTSLAAQQKTPLPWMPQVFTPEI